MTTEKEKPDREAYIDAALDLHALRIAPEWRDNIGVHFAAIETAARLVAAYRLDDELEAAPIFKP